MKNRHALILVLIITVFFASSPLEAQEVLDCSSSHPGADGDRWIEWSGAKKSAADSIEQLNCPPRPVATHATEHCPAYATSPLYRTRRNKLTIGPTDDWQAMIEAARPNTEILMLDGEYELTDYAVVLGNRNVTIRGASGDRDAVRIVGQGYGPGSEGFMVLAANITIADLTMSAIRNHAISIKPESGAARAHIYNVHLFNIGTQHIKGSSGDASVRGVVACSSIGYTPSGAQGDYLGAIDIHKAVNWIVRDNYIYNINGDGSGCEVDIDCGTYIYGAPAVYLWNGSRGSIVERNTVIDSYRGIALGLGSGHAGGVIRNNFIYRPVAGDAGIELWTANGAVVEHNTVILGGDYPGAIEYRESSNITIRNNLVSVRPWNRGNNDRVVLEGNINNADVRDFITPGDPHLRSDSRAIGAGVASSLATDIDGDSRTGRRDVGADHYTVSRDDPDEDGDGVDVDSDRCPATPSRAIVNSSGCSIAQLVPCKRTRVTKRRWKNHRQYVYWVTKISKRFARQGLITEKERRNVVRVAARSRCGK